VPRGGAENGGVPDQDTDGVLDVYHDRLRFGLATFDGWDTYVGSPPLVSNKDFDFAKSESESGLWSYNPARAIGADVRSAEGTKIGDFWYPNCTTNFMMDTGVRGPQAGEGALVAAIDPAHAGDVNDQMQLSLRGVRPYGGTPIAASLDDMYYYLARDPAMESERARDKRPYVILITDGYPDDDYRSFACDCATTEDPSSATYCGGSSNDPTKMHCPYPIAEDAARALHCGQAKGRWNAYSSSAT
jgi:hypothetical protein